MEIITSLEDARRVIEDLQRDNARALSLIDKLNMLNGAMLTAVTEKGTLTKDEYNRIYARVLSEWQAKQK